MPYITPRAVALAVLVSALPAAAAAQGAAPTLPMEVFAGRLRYAPELEAGDADVAGVRLGVDVGAYTGVRGFYWRQLGGDDPAQGYGAEAQLNLNVGNGVTPFLVGGVVRLDFPDGSGELPADRTLPLAGGGLRLDLGRFGVQGAVRAYLDEAENADGGRDLAASTMYSAGIAFRLGRRGGRAAAAPAPAPLRVVRGDTVYVVEQEGGAPERMITIPLPREGELYLRYGPAGESRIVGPAAAAEGETDAAQAERVRRQVVGDLEPLIRGILAAEQAALREAVRAEVARSGGALTPEAEDRLIERVEAAVTLRLRDELARAAARGDSLLPLAGDTAAVAEPAARAERFVPRLRGLRPFAGGNLDRPRQFVAGVRLDLGPFDQARPQVRLIPEATFGTGQGGNSGMLAANVAYEAAPVSVGALPVRPYGYAGVGFLFFGRGAARRAQREAVLNLGYGVLLPVPNRPAELFVEHQGIDLFDLNRVLVGVRFLR